MCCCCWSFLVVVNDSRAAAGVGRARRGRTGERAIKRCSERPKRRLLSLALAHSLRQMKRARRETTSAMETNDDGASVHAEVFVEGRAHSVLFHFDLSSFAPKCPPAPAADPDSRIVDMGGVAAQVGPPSLRLE